MNTNSSVDESFIEHLRIKRSLTTQPVQKRKKIKIPAGFSYAHYENSDDETSDIDTNLSKVVNNNSNDYSSGSMETVVVTTDSKEDECPVSHEWKYAVDNFVLFTYFGTMYPGMISSIDSDGAVIQSMEKTKRFYRWPQKEDKMFYKWSDILMKINPPKLVRRGYFQVDELTEYTDWLLLDNFS